MIIFTTNYRLLLKAEASTFDLILVDCPPSLSTLPINALLAAHDVLIPLQCEYYAMEGLGQILAKLEECHDRFGRAPNNIHILPTMYDGNVEFHGQVIDEVRKHLGDQIFKTVIPRDIALTAAPSHNQTIIQFDPLSAGSLAYLAATKELFNGIR